MSFGTPPKGRNPEEPSIHMDYGSPPERGRTTQVHKLNDITQISALSYKSGFGFIFFMTDKNNVIKVLKLYFLDPRDRENTESMDYELPNKYINVELAQKLKAKIAESGFADDDGYPKRVESTLNFNKEAQIQGEVYEASSSNGPLCPQIYDSYIVENNKSLFFLEGLLNKCRDEDVEAKNMIQYLIDIIKGSYQRYDIGCILMEYAEGYTISTADNSENVIYANIRLLLETGYLHLDLNYGNVMVSGENVRLIDFGKSKKILDLLKNDKDIENFNKIAKKDVLEANDIIPLIECINYFDIKYGINNLKSGLFQQNFVGNTNTSYENIALKLNARENKIIHTDLMKEATQPASKKSRSNTSIQPMKKDLFGSPDSSPQKTGKRLFGETDDDNENMNPNPIGLITPRKGGTKRKHKNKSKKTRKNKSNKKRVKLISKK